MKRIRIFLASSINDLKFDRIEIGNFFRQLNDIYIESGIYFDLTMCEDYDNGIALEGKQSQFDALLRDSELVFFVFFNKVGQYTRHEFEVALDSYKTSQKPKIVTYFKYVSSTEDVAKEVRDFMEMLDGELRHYYNMYQEIDTLKLGMFMQIKLMRLDNTEVSIESGKLMYGKTLIADTKNIPMFERNESLRKLQEKLAEAEEKFRSAKVAFLKSQTDEDYLAFSAAASEKEKVEKELRELETAVLSAAEKMYEVTTDGRILSEKQKQAYRHMEKGEWELALAILDKNEIISELSHNQSLGSGIRDRIAVNVGELLQRIEALRASGLNGEVIEEILSLYETVYEVTVKYNLPLKPIAQYASFLYDDIRQTEKAERITQKLSYLYADPDREADLEARAELLFLRGKICTELKRYDAAVELLAGGIKICEDLYDREGARVATLCGGMRNITANALFFLKQYKEAFTYYEEAKRYYEIAYEYDPKANKGWLAMIYDNYGNILEKEERYEEALEYHLKAVEIYRVSAQEQEKHRKSLARVYHNTAVCYDKMEDYDRCEQYLLESIRLREEIREKNPAVVENPLSGTYYSLALLYTHNKKDPERAIAAFEASKKIRLLLRKRSSVYAAELRSCFISLIYNVEDLDMPEKKAQYRAEYLDILMELPELTPAERREFCEEGIRLAYHLETVGEYEKALTVLLRAVDIYHEEGRADWYVSIGFGDKLLLERLCGKLDKPEILETYAPKMVAKRADEDEENW